MDQLSVSLAGTTPGPITAEHGAPAAARALNRAVSTAVSDLNSAGYAGEGRELTFSVDHATKKPVIKVIETATKEVISQWPPEYLLEIAAQNTNDKRDSG
jgi:uncharacterized FlaG/YvyC family protein